MDQLQPPMAISELKLVFVFFNWKVYEHPLLGWPLIYSCLDHNCDLILISNFPLFSYLLNILPYLLYLLTQKPLWPFHYICHDHFSQLHESSFYCIPIDVECIVWRVSLTRSEKGKQTATLWGRQKTINPLSKSSRYPGLATQRTCVHSVLLGHYWQLLGKCHYEK